MKKIIVRGLRTAFAMVLVATASIVSAQEAAPKVEQRDAAPGDESWYYRSTPERTAPVRLSVLKAQQRGAERMARLEAMRWYGFSNSRPTAAAMPWTTMYSHAWQQPGGRPFAWHMSTRPVIIVTHSAPFYR
jgi:hypothetical protein